MHKVVQYTIEETPTFYRVRTSRKQHLKNLAENAEYRAGFWEIIYHKNSREKQLTEEIAGLVLSGQDSMIFETTKGNLIEVNLKIFPTWKYTSKQREYLSNNYAKKLAETLLSM